MPELQGLLSPHSHALTPLGPPSQPLQKSTREGGVALLLNMPGSFEVSKGLAETSGKAIGSSTLRRNTVPTVGRESKAPWEQGAQSYATP